MKKILQISPYGFDHLWWVEKYAQILDKIFGNSLKTVCGWEDFPIFEPVAGCSVPKIWNRECRSLTHDITPKNTSAIISHIRFSPSAWWAFWLAKKKKIPYIHIEHGSSFLIHKNPFIRWVAKLCDVTIGKYLIRNADYIIPISKACDIWVRETFGRTKNIQMIYRGFEATNFPKIHNKTPIIGFVGRLIPFKNVGLLIRSLKNLENLDWQCEIVGDGEMRSEWENLTKNFELTNRITFVWAQKHQDVLKKFFPKIDIFINPSLQEWLPTTVIEAKLAGCQVIATDVGGTAEIPDICLVDANEQSLTKAIKKALTGEQMPSQNLEKFPFTLDKMHNNFEQIFDKILWTDEFSSSTKTEAMLSVSPTEHS